MHYATQAGPSAALSIQPGLTTRDPFSVLFNWLPVRTIVVNLLRDQAEGNIADSESEEASEAFATAVWHERSRIMSTDIRNRGRIIDAERIVRYSSIGRYRTGRLRRRGRWNSKLAR